MQGKKGEGYIGAMRGSDEDGQPVLTFAHQPRRSYQGDEPPFFREIAL